MDKEKETLFRDEFPPVSHEEWLKKVTADLKGADFDKKLVWKPVEGFKVNPLYTPKDIEPLDYLKPFPGEFPYIRGNRIRNNEWNVRQNLIVSDYTKANEKALDILMRGVNSLGFVIEDPDTVSTESFSSLFRNIFTTSIEVVLDAGGRSLEAVQVLETVLRNNNHDLLKIRGGLEADPLGKLLQNGQLCVSVDEAMDYAMQLFRASQNMPGFRPLSLNGVHFNNAGASAVQEVAYTLSVAAEYLDRLTEKGLDINTLAGGMRFNLGVGSNYFMEIAKLRAARLLWAHMVKAYKPTGNQVAAMNIHCITSRWNKTIYDPYVNMLRTQTEAMSATLGGADSLTVEPFDKIFKEPSEFSERIARNQQLLLKEEAHFDKVTDPAAGSYYIETLTDSMVTEAWKLFLATEEKGGFLKNIESGAIQKDIEKVVETRRKNILRRKEVFLGTTQYPNAEEKLDEQVQLAHAMQDAEKEEDLMVEPLHMDRGPVEFELLRLSVERAPKTPRVFLLTIGHPAMRTARAQFASGFFATGGYDVVDNIGFDTPEEGVQEALKQKADIVVVCSSDPEYAETVPEVHKLLKGKAITVVAGAPDSTEALKDQGIEHFIHLRSNILDELTRFNELLHIRR